ncbi:unnamed protein product [Penicillium glandicola]
MPRSKKTENSIFDAILRGVLHAVQFTVIADKGFPNKVLESYTFTFDNFGERGTADRLTKGPETDFVSPHEDRANMRNMIRREGYHPTVDHNVCRKPGIA